MNDTETRDDAERQIAQPVHGWRGRIIRYLKRKKQERKTRQEQETAADRAARRTANATIWIAFFTFVSIAVSGGTLWVLKRTLIEIQSSGTETHTLAQAADTQAKKMSDVSDAADKIRKAAQDMVIQDQRIADNAQRGLDASNRQSKAGLDATVANMRLDERPWLVISQFQLSAEPDETNETSITCLLANTGKTPAVNATNQFVELIATTVPPISTFGPAIGSRSVVPPGTATMKFTTKPWRAPPAFISRYRDKAATLYLHAMLRYKDTFGTEHWTTVCVYRSFGMPLNEFDYCENGNEVDQNR